MTSFPETRYKCDRCELEEIIPMASVAPPQERMAGPGNWMMLRLGSDAHVPPSHLCEHCTMLFNEFMQGGRA